MRKLLVVWYRNGKVSTVEASSSTYLSSLLGRQPEEEIEKAQIWGGPEVIELI